MLPNLLIFIIIILWVNTTILPSDKRSAFPAHRDTAAVYSLSSYPAVLGTLRGWFLEVLCWAYVARELIEAAKMGALLLSWIVSCYPKGVSTRGICSWLKTATAHVECLVIQGIQRQMRLKIKWRWTLYIVVLNVYVGPSFCRLYRNMRQVLSKSILKGQEDIQNA